MQCFFFIIIPPQDSAWSGSKITSAKSLFNFTEVDEQRWTPRREKWRGALKGRETGKQRHLSTVYLLRK